MIRNLLLFAMLLVTGCNYYWHQDGKSFDECKDDLQACVDELEEYSRMEVIDKYEVDYIEDCMVGKGYRLVRQDKLPRDAKRQDPAENTYWLLRGLAGSP